MANQRTFQLASGSQIPLVGFGTWQSPKNEVRKAVEIALKAGYRHIDCAYIYGNEEEVGEAIAASGIPREKLWITSKLWNTFHDPADVPSALDLSLKKLGVDYLDLYLMHWPVAFKSGKETFPKGDDGKAYVVDTDYVDTWKAMEKLLDTGKVKNIGVSNFQIQHLERVLKEGSVTPAVLQVETHVYHPQNELYDFCKKHGIHITAYSPLGSGSEPKLMDDPVIVEIAKKNNHTEAQVLLSWLLARDISIIPKSVTEKRIVSNFDVFELSKEDIEKINNIKTRKRVVSPDWMKW
ncbi:Aldo/keto reductase [Basidiobolus meristosporus CBS 931.73]|uniref:Aldo/keto reductase n=1 Tax=Basidiobolus meristosporus CBS 931.73 TaxID=1314790 RepID=A0A1Y1XIT7_9FUNG|nr:Aldo/keto reductase [Basidiobolus meristosporus CBS 931.73]|eukprot:ORX85296.1 Aldo/keto reductase [Basidiobolus meristosporus CBS 931.73]